jgi:multidrug resistance efflux pump
LDRITSDYNRYNNLYKSHSITKQQYEQALAAKLEVSTAATKSKRVSKNQLLLPNQKFQVN